MANICFNFIQAFGDAEAIKKFKNDLSNEKFEEELFVMSWYFGGVNYIGKETEPTGLEFTSESRWSPPREWIEQASKDYGVLIECEYEECGDDIAGKFAYDKGKLVMDLNFTYLEGKYYFMDWDEFVDFEVTSLLEDEKPFDEFIALFDFVSDEHLIELEELFFEHANEN
jgi:hypothetical protein